MKMSSLKLRILFVSALTAALLAALAVRAGGQLKVNDPFPNLKDFGLEGKVPDSLQGKVVLVDFWASWCAPCKASFPAMADLQRRFGDRLVVIAVGVDEKRSAMDEFLKKTPASFTVVRDAKQTLVEAANVSTMPTSFLLDGEGRVRFVHNGFKGDETRKEYEKEIASLLDRNSVTQNSR